jgi:uncharacterized protein YceH (UPF0502 family)
MTDSDDHNGNNSEGVEQNHPSEPSEQAMLTAVEARVLGALMEKQLTTADSYPLTANSLVLACNQKTSREPVTNLTEGEVQRCLSQLQDRKLVEVEYGSRANRYDQRLTRVLGLDEQAQAVLNVMMLRGPQTVSDLFARTQRTASFTSATEIEELLHHLSQKTKPVVQKLPRQSGQREERYVHLLCGKPDLSAFAAAETNSSTTGSSSSVRDLEERVTQLERQVAQLLELNGIKDE